MRTFTFASKIDGTPIFVRTWRSPAGIHPRAAIQITHGLGEDSGRYDRFARFLTAHGYVVYALDLRGPGETAGRENLGHADLTAWDDMTGRHRTTVRHRPDGASDGSVDRVRV